MKCLSTLQLVCQLACTGAHRNALWDLHGKWYKWEYLPKMDQDTFQVQDVIFILKINLKGDGSEKYWETFATLECSQICGTEWQLHPVIRMCRDSVSTFATGKIVWEPDDESGDDWPTEIPFIYAQLPPSPVVVKMQDANYHPILVAASTELEFDPNKKPKKDWQHDLLLGHQFVNDITTSFQPCSNPKTELTINNKKQTIVREDLLEEVGYKFNNIYLKEHGCLWCSREIKPEGGYY